ncbi:hypothetical protein [Melittangium boletus]|uniref:hypothetical protein n=1 Tax=Melittangium boletus TaxID=83453 RepID=UPI003DA39010
MDHVEVRRRMARALEERGIGPTRGEPLEDDALPEGLRVLVAVEGLEAARAAALVLFEQEFTTLLWPPPLGISILRVILEAGAVDARLLAVACGYVSLFYPELDATTDQGKALLAAGASPGDLRAFADLLRGKLATLEP